MIPGVPYNQRQVLLHFNTKVALVNLITEMWLSACSRDFFFSASNVWLIRLTNRLKKQKK